MRHEARQGRFWRGLGAVWAHFGRLSGALGRLLAALGRLLAAPGRLLGGSWALLGASWSHLGARGCLRARFSRVLDASEPNFGQLWEQLWPRFSDTMRLLLHEAQHYFHIRFSFNPCSAAVRAQHMELEPCWGKLGLKLRSLASFGALLGALH